MSNLFRLSRHPLGWSGTGKFPKRHINNPKVDVDGLWTGVCVFCGGSLGGPYSEDLAHSECEAEAERRKEIEILVALMLDRWKTTRSQKIMADMIEKFFDKETKAKKSTTGINYDDSGYGG